jgi:hypothetical protein
MHMKLFGSALVVSALALSGCGGASCDGVGEMCLLAGTGVQEATDQQGLMATKTPLYWVSSVRTGPDGRVYLIEQNNYRIRVIDKDGKLETFAGTGIHSGFIVGAQATQSPFLDPYDFVFRADGSMVLVSWHDPRLAAIGTDGTLSVVAGLGHTSQDTLAAGCVAIGDGGPALQAGICELSAIAIDATGRLFLADDESFQIYMIDTAGVFHILGGDGMSGYDGDGGPAKSAHFNTPNALAIDLDGNLLISDNSNNVIRKIDMTSMVVSTVVGNGTPGYSGDGGSCTAASLNQPSGIVVAADGSMYVSDTYNDRIRHVSTSGTIETFAGTGTSGLTGNDGPALDAELKHSERLSITSGVLYIADTLNNVARSIRLQ